MIFLETLLCREGRCPWLQWHQQRLDRTCRAAGIVKRYRLETLVRPPASGVYRCRVLYGADEAVTEYLPYVRRRVDTLRLVEDDRIEYRYKSADRRALDALFRRRGDADDVLIVRRGLVTDSTVANTAFYIDGRWLTPTEPLLEGTTRARLLYEGVLECASLSPADVLAAEKVAVMNALSGFVEVPGGILS